MPRIDTAGSFQRCAELILGVFADKPRDCGIARRLLESKKQPSVQVSRPHLALAGWR